MPVSLKPIYIPIDFLLKNAPKGSRWMDAWPAKETPDDQRAHKFLCRRFPDGVRRGELRLPFNRFGQVTDVYIGVNKDYKGKNYAFVRLVKVKEEKEQEMKLQSIKYRDILLKLTSPNINGKYERTTTMYPRAKLTPEQLLLSTAPLLLNLFLTTTHDYHTPMRQEAINFDHIGNLPASLLINEGTKYFGGLRVALDFNSSIEANQFLDDKSRWKDWFNRMTNSEQQELRYERTA
ncbi:hypothetical protein LXL04_022704 [Taraxacum kok-saghyz]